MGIEKRLGIGGGKQSPGQAAPDYDGVTGCCAQFLNRDIPDRGRGDGLGDVKARLL